ncbi:MAG TPA: filamentous hemagglutinin N-terminal domain-containing protein, partial [Chlamydiales bacterium]
MRFLAFLLYTPFLLALPTAPEVVSGEASCVQETPQSLQITASDKAILHFDSFGVGAGEEVRFIQPNSRSSVLGRVVGKDPSEIFGKIEANGRLFLVNPQGIYFGPGASVNAGSFIASTLHLLDEDFLKENYRFFAQGKTGALIHEGSIHAVEAVALLGAVVQNRGSIVAEAGRVVLATGEKIALDFTGDGLIQFAVEGELERALIEHCGDIRAKSVDLSLRAAQQAIRTVLNTDGIEVATAVEESNGVIRLLG